MPKVVIGLGSNVGERLNYIRRAIENVLSFAESTEWRISDIYESEPWGFVEQASFLNAAVQLITSLPPARLLEELKLLEVRLGRVARFRNGPREIDLDILAYGDAVVQTPELIVPHPGLLEREFQLRPFVDCWPEWIHPTWQQSAEDLLNSRFPLSRIRRIQPGDGAVLRLDKESPSR